MPQAQDAQERRMSCNWLYVTSHQSPITKAAAFTVNYKRFKSIKYKTLLLYYFVGNYLLIGIHLDIVRNSEEVCAGYKHSIRVFMRGYCG